MGSLTGGGRLQKSNDIKLRFQAATPSELHFLLQAKAFTEEWKKANPKKDPNVNAALGRRYKFTKKYLELQIYDDKAPGKWYNISRYWR